MINVRQSIHYYQAEDRSVPFLEWLRGLRDLVGQSRVRSRLKNLEYGYFGDWKTIQGPLIELRIHSGPGYRMYGARISLTAVVILWGGDKSTQSRDIRRAQLYWIDYQRRST